MIRISKPAAPKTLTDKGAAETSRMNAAYNAAPADYRSGKLGFKFSKSIYGGKPVKNALIKAQHSKCFACESNVTAVSHGDVEHFRPKGGFKQTPKDEMGKPGYYWLAYAWDNLFLSCQICNQTFKKNWFPLSDPHARARDHLADLAEEKPLVIHPEREDPRTHIEFVEDVPRAKNGSKKGDMTIQVMGLDRPLLQEQRLEILSLIRPLAEISLDPDLPEPKRKALEKKFAAMRSPERSYSAMIDDFLKARGL